MTRQQHLEFCKICTHRKRDLSHGIICGLTDRIADFEGECSSFVEDAVLVKKETERNPAYAIQANVADKGKRFANYFIDQLFVIGFGAILGALLGVLFALFAPRYLDLFLADNLLMDIVIGIAVTVVYYSFFEGVTGRSIGKFFTNTKVVTEHGEKPDFGTIFVRSLCRNIPFNAFSFLSSDSVGWHDRFSRTRVVVVD